MPGALSSKGLFLANTDAAVEIYFMHISNLQSTQVKQNSWLRYRRNVSTSRQDRTKTALDLAEEEAPPPPVILHNAVD